MKLKKVNDFFGMSLTIIGILKVVLIILVLIESGNAATALVTGSEYSGLSLKSFSAFIGYGQIILAISSIVMIFVNMKKYPGVIVGYLIGLGALALEVILPSIIFFIYAFVECGLYIKAGNTIRNKEFKLFNIEEDSSAKVESTDWFYGDKK